MRRVKRGSAQVYDLRKTCHPLGAIIALIIVAWSAPVRAQGFVPTPALGEVGTEVELAVESAEGERIAGVDVRAYAPSGEAIDLGVTDAAGTVRFRPAIRGDYELEAVLPAAGVRWIALYRVRPARRTVLSWICVPAGVLLLSWSLRRWRHQVA